MREKCQFDVSLLCPWSQKQRETGYCICCLLKKIATAVTGEGMFIGPYQVRIGEHVEALDKEFLLEYLERLKEVLKEFNKPMQTKLKGRK